MFKFLGKYPFVHLLSCRSRHIAAPKGGTMNSENRSPVFVRVNFMTAVAESWMHKAVCLRNW
jgi:hypothetical protein